MKQTVKTSRAAGQLEKMFRELNKHYFCLLYTSDAADE